MVDQRLENLINRVLSIPMRKLTDDTSLFHDCGVAGMDGEEFMEAFAREFKVDLSSFDCDTYFGPEVAFNPFVYLWDVLKGRGLDPRKRVPRLPLRHLKEVAKSGAWFPRNLG